MNVLFVEPAGEIDAQRPVEREPILPVGGQDAARKAIDSLVGADGELCFGVRKPYPWLTESARPRSPLDSTPFELLSFSGSRSLRRV